MKLADPPMKLASATIVVDEFGRICAPNTELLLLTTIPAGASLLTGLIRARPQIVRRSPDPLVIMARR